MWISILMVGLLTAAISVKSPSNVENRGVHICLGRDLSTATGECRRDVRRVSPRDIWQASAYLSVTKSRGGRPGDIGVVISRKNKNGSYTVVARMSGADIDSSCQGDASGCLSGSRAYAWTLGAVQIAYTYATGASDTFDFGQTYRITLGFKHSLLGSATFTFVNG